VAENSSTVGFTTARHTRRSPGRAAPSGGHSIFRADVTGYDDFEANRIKHMEMIQAVVSRLGNNSFVVKGWAITVAGAFFAFSVSRDEPGIALAGLLPVVAFYAVDAYYLQSERLFRVLFDQVREGDPSVPAFFMGATAPAFRERMSALGKDVAWHDTSWRPTLFLYYLGLAAAGLVIAGVLGAD
jgi:hypothetical protein